MGAFTDKKMNIVSTTQPKAMYAIGMPPISPGDPSISVLCAVQPAPVPQPAVGRLAADSFVHVGGGATRTALAAPTPARTDACAGQAWPTLGSKMMGFSVGIPTWYTLSV